MFLISEGSHLFLSAIPSLRPDTGFEDEREVDR